MRSSKTLKIEMGTSMPSLKSMSGIRGVSSSIISPHPSHRRLITDYGTKERTTRNTTILGGLKTPIAS